MDEKHDGTQEATTSAIWNLPANGTQHPSSPSFKKAPNGSALINGKKRHSGYGDQNDQVIVLDSYFPGRPDLDEAKEGISLKRRRLIGVRLKTYGKRRQFGAQLEQLIRILAKLTPKLWLPIVNRVPNSRHLLVLFEELQQAKDSVQELGNEYDRLEDQLQGTELKFEKAIQQFMNRFDALLQGQPKAIQTSRLSREASHSLPSVSSQTTQSIVELPPLLNDYYTRLGDANSLRERMINLLLGYYDHLSGNDHGNLSRLFSGAGRDSFATYFAGEWGQCLDELDAAEADIRNLGREARRQGLLSSFNSSAGSEEGGIYGLAKSQRTPFLPDTQNGGSVPPLDPSRDVPLSTRQRVNEWFTKNMDASEWEVWLYRAVTDDTGGLESKKYVELVKTADEEEQSPPETIFGSEAAYLSSIERRSGLTTIEIAAGEKSRISWQHADFEVTGHHRSLSY